MIEISSSYRIIKIKYNCFQALVAKVKTLDFVTVKYVPLELEDGETIMVPSGWAIEMGDLSLQNIRSNEEDEESPLATVSEDIDEEVEIETPSMKKEAVRIMNGNDHFVVRNEFGHARIQQLVERLQMEEIQDISPVQSNNDKIIGGHCVLNRPCYQECISKGWGEQHPFAGRYHPIADTMIPETTLMFYCPRNSEELEQVWKIVQASYEWAISDVQRQLMDK